MRVLIADDFEDMRELLDFVLTAEMGLDTVMVKSGREGIELLQSDSGFDLIISDLNMPNGSGAELFAHCQKKGLHCPFILMSGDRPEHHPELHSAPLHWLTKPFEIPELISRVTEILESVQQPTDTYVPVALNLLRKMQNVETPLFVRINDQKYVKISGQPTTFDEEEHQKYTARGLRYLYIESARADEFIAAYRKKVLSMNAWQSASSDDHEMVSLNIELLKNLSVQLGWDFELVELARQSIHRTLHLVKMHPGMQSILNQMHKIERYGFADHCTLSLLVSTGLLKSMGYNDEMTFAKMTFASILHDMNLTDDQYDHKAKLMKKIAKGERASHDVQVIFEHPSKAADLCRAWNFCPPDVDQIILNHHERPNGTGFPRAVTSNELDFLCSMFIISEDFTDYFISSFGKINVAAYIRSRQETFNRGHFKSIFRGLETALTSHSSQAA